MVEWPDWFMGLFKINHKSHISDRVLVKIINLPNHPENTH